MTRKQLAAALHVKGQDIKLIENGLLPASDFVLVSALERYFNVMLRKEGVVASPPPASELRIMREQPRWMRLYGQNTSASEIKKEMSGLHTRAPQTHDAPTPQGPHGLNTPAKRESNERQGNELTGSGIELDDED